VAGRWSSKAESPAGGPLATGQDHPFTLPRYGSVSMRRTSSSRL
jgi:hypothetical protein